MKLLAAAAGLLLAAALPVPAPALSHLRGVVLPSAVPAVDFSLTDQHGRAFRMASTRGRVVVLSFLYTHCTDVCPFLALKLKEAAQLLGADARELVIVPVTTDPLRDTPAVLARYSRAIDMYDSWHFVTGSVPQMRAVWNAYAISVERAVPGAAAGAAAGSAASGSVTDGQPAGESDAVVRGLSREDRERAAGQLIETFGGGYEVSHDTPFWIVDRRGMLREWLGADATPADIASDVRSLLAE